MGRNNKNVRTRGYKDRLGKLPTKIQNLAEGLFREVFLVNPEDKRLKNHPLEDIKRGRHRNGSQAVSITLRYRAIYVVDGDTNVWYWVGSHEDYNTFTGSK